MRFEVPQFIEVEDKIVGPLTWKQFVYLAGGIGMLIISYFKFPFILFLLLGVPFGILAVTLAFHRINNRPFSIFLESFIQYFTKKKLYVWRKSEMQAIIEHADPQKLPEPKLAYTSKKTIHALAQKLEHNAIPEK